MKFKFNLKWLLLIIALCAVVMWWFSKAGMTVAHVIIVTNQLELNDQGTIDGHVQCQLVEATDYSFNYSDFLCVMYHVDNKNLLTLKKDQRARIEYRHEPVWPFTKLDDPYRIFLNGKLGIPDSEILGAVRREDHMEIVIRGGNSPAED